MNYRLNSYRIKTNLNFAPEIEYVDSGDPHNSKIVVYLLGGDVRPKDNSEFISKLSENFRVITLYFPSRLNYKYIGNLSREKYFAVFDTLTTYLNIESYDLIGTSLGGSLAIIYANRTNKNLKHIVAIAPQITPIRTSMFGGFLKLTSRMLKRTKETKSIVPLLQHFSHLGHLKALIKITDFIKTVEIQEDISNLKQPTLILRCGQDDLIGGNENFEKIPKGNNVKSRLFPNANHSLLYTNLEEVLCEINRFLN